MNQYTMNRIQYIDGLKGIGALMVFFTHYRMMGLFYPNSVFLHNPFFRLVMCGDLAVHIFLIVSGFSIALSITNKLNSPNLKELQKLILKRYFRLALPISLILVINGVLYCLGAFPAHEWVAQLGAHENAIHAYQDLGIFRLPLAILFCPIGVNYGWLSPVWMLKYIFLGTFLVVALRIGTNGLKLKLIIFWNILFLCIFAFVSEYYVSIVFGNFLLEMNSKIKTNELLAFLLLALGITMFIATKQNINVVVSILLVSSVFLSDMLKKVFSFRGFLWLGSISFSLYLIHHPLICSFSLWLGRDVLHFSNPYVNSFCLFCITFLFLLILSNLYTIYFERRVCGKLMRYLQYKLI